MPCAVLPRKAPLTGRTGASVKLRFLVTLQLALSYR